MFSEFSFIEYSVPHKNLDEVLLCLYDLGYVKVADHINRSVTVWKLNYNILFLKEIDQIAEPNLTGIGFVCDQETINTLNAGYDQDSDMYVCTDPTGMRIMLCPSSSYQQNNSLISDRYQVCNTELKTEKNTLEYISGMVRSQFSEAVMEFYEQLGFRITKDGDTYVTMVDSNNRFSLLFNKSLCVKNTLIHDTNDVFYTTAKFLNKQFNLRKYFENTVTEFGDLNFKINGYNCIAVGNEESYSIENSASNVLPNMDMIFRMRKQYPHFQEGTIIQHTGITNEQSV